MSQLLWTKAHLLERGGGGGGGQLAPGSLMLFVAMCLQEFNDCTKEFFLKVTMIKVSKTVLFALNSVLLARLLLLPYLIKHYLCDWNKKLASSTGSNMIVYSNL